MRNATKNRLEQLETENLTLGQRIFRQDIDEPAVYRDINEPDKAHSQADIDALVSSGWQVLVVRYVDAMKELG